MFIDTDITLRMRRKAHDLTATAHGLIEAANKLDAAAATDRADQSRNAVAQARIDKSLVSAYATALMVLRRSEASSA